jgi:hypothetical protein
MKMEKSFGGLGYDELDIGSVLAFGGISTSIMALFVTPPIERRYGSVAIYRFGLIGTTPLVTFFWAMGGLQKVTTSWGAWTAVTTVVLMKNVFFNLAFTGTSLMVTNSVPSAHLGSANGFGQTVGSFSRAVGPALCGLIWSLGIRIHFVPLTFFVIGLFSCGCVGLGYALPSSLRYSHGTKIQVANKELPSQKSKINHCAAPVEESIPGH